MTVERTPADHTFITRIRRDLEAAGHTVENAPADGEFDLEVTTDNGSAAVWVRAIHADEDAVSFDVPGPEADHDNHIYVAVFVDAISFEPTGAAFVAGDEALGDQAPDTGEHLTVSVRPAVADSPASAMDINVVALSEVTAWIGTELADLGDE